MKKTNRFFWVIVGLLVVMAFLTASPIYATDTMRPAPAGLRWIKSKSEIRPGTIVYNRSGKRAAIVRAYAPRHKFHDGQVGVGILIQMISNGGKRWEYETIFYSRYFLKK